MKSSLKLFITLFFINIALITNAQIAINSDGSLSDASAMLDVTSTTKGILIPRMTTAERTTISSPATGLMVYDTDESAFWYYNGTAWTGIGGSSAFTSDNGITYSNSNSDDFVFGADSLDYGSGTEYKMFFDKSKGAFRAGTVTGTTWNESNIGNYSVGFGYNTTANGAYAVAMGVDATASGLNSVAIGTNATASSTNAVGFSYALASGSYSTAFSHATASGVYATAFSDARASGEYSTAFSDATASGYFSTAFSFATASGDYSTAFGLKSQAYSYNEFAIGTYNTTYTPNDATDFDSEDRLFVIGNGTGSSNRSDAMVVYKNGNTALNGTVTISEDGNSADSSAIFDISSSDKGVLIPRMTTSERTAISNPATSLLVYDTDESSYWYYENNEWLEIATQSDISDLESTIQEPEHTNTLSIGNNAIEMIASGQYLYILENNGGQIRVVNISIANTPTSVATFGISSAKDIAISGNYAYVVCNTTSSNLWVFDISTPSSIDTIGSFDLGEAFTSIDISGDYAYITDNTNEKLRIIDISTPASPTQVAEVDDMYSSGAGKNNSVWVFDNYAYVFHTPSSSLNSDIELSVIDISTPTSPSLISTTTVSSNTIYRISSLFKYGDYLYFDSDGESVVEYINVSNLASVTTGSFTGGGLVYTILPYDNYIFISGDVSDSEFHVKDFENSYTAPSSAYSVENKVTSGGSTEMVISGSHLYTLTDGGELISHQIASMYIELVAPDGSVSYYDGFDDLGNHTASENLQLNSNYLSNDGDDEGISIADDGKVTFSNNILLNSNYLSNDGGDEGISIADNGAVSTSSYFTVGNNIKLNDNYLSNDGGNEGLSIEDDGTITTSSNLILGGNIKLSGNFLSNDGNDEGISIANSGKVTFSNNILLNSNYLSNDGGDEGISIANNGEVTTSSYFTVGNNIKLNSNFLSNDGDDEGLSIADDGAVSTSSYFTVGNNIKLNSNFLSNDGDDEGLSIADDGAVSTSSYFTLGDNIKLNSNFLSNDGGDEGLSIADDGAVSTSSYFTVGNNIKLNSNYLSNDGDDEGIYVDTTGNVGIGTASPKGKFHIYDNNNNALILQSGDNSSNTGIAWQNSAAWYAWGIYRDNNGEDLVIKGGDGGKSTVDELTEQLRVSTDGVTIGNDLTITGTVNGPVTIGNDLTVNGPVTIGNDLTVNGPVSMDDSLTVNGPVTIGNDLTVNGSVSMDDSLTVDGPVDISEDLTVSGAISMNNNIAYGEDRNTDSFSANSGTQTLATTSSMTLKAGDILKIEANTALKLDDGSGTDDFELYVEINATSGCIDDKTQTIRARPSEDSNDHNNYQLYPYLAVFVVTCDGTYNFKLIVENTGDDDWIEQNTILVVTKY